MPYQRITIDLGGTLPDMLAELAGNGCPGHSPESYNSLPASGEYA